MTSDAKTSAGNRLRQFIEGQAINQTRHTMTDYDRGAFVEGRIITIEPCDNGTFLVLRGGHPNMQSPASVVDGQIAFSSASDMLRFLQSEYGEVDVKTDMTAIDMERLNLPAKEYAQVVKTQAGPASGPSMDMWRNRKMPSSYFTEYAKTCDCDVCKGYTGGALAFRF